MASDPVKGVNESDVTPPAEESLDFDDDILRARAEVYRNQGNEEYTKRNFKNAISFYTEGIKVNCKDKELNAKLYSNRALAHFYLGNYHKSLSDSKHATELQPTYLRAIVRGASACVELNQFEEAITWCDKGLALDENNEVLLELKATSVIGNIELQQKDTEEVKKELETKPEKGKGEDSAENEATVTVNKALDSNDDCLREKAEAYKSKGNDEYGEKNFSNAIRLYTEGIKVNCKDKELNAKLYSNRAIAHFYLGNYHGSLQDAEAATELQPTFLKAFIRGASACVQLNRFEEAITWCDKGLAISKTDRQLLDLRATSVKEQTKLQNTDGKKEQETSGAQTGNDSRFKNSDNPGNFCGNVDDVKKTITDNNQALSVAKDKGDKAGEGRAYENLGDSFQKLGDYKQAIYYYNLRLQIAKEVGEKCEEGVVYGRLGNCFFGLSEFKKAIDCHNQHLSIAKELRDKTEEGTAYGNLGTAFQSLGSPTKAIEYHNLHLQIAQEVGDKAGEGRAYGNLGNAFDSLGDRKTAIHYHNLSIVCAREVGDRAGEAGSYGNLGIIFESLGNCRKAVEYYNLHLSVAKEIGDKKGEACAYGNLGNAFQRLGDLEKAIKCHESCLIICKDMGDKEKEGLTYGNLSIVFQSLGDVSKAIDYSNRHLAIAKEIGDKIGEGYTYGNLGMAFYSLGDFQKAVHYHSLCLQVVKEVGDKAGERRAYNNLCNAYFRLGDFTNAMHYNKLRLDVDKGVGDT